MNISKRPMLGIVVLAVGHIITGGVLYEIQSEQGEFREAVTGHPGPLSFWRPTSYEILRVPDYLLGYLVLGVFISTTGLTMLASPFLKRVDGHAEESR
jgi:hypothetical protein